MRPLSNEEISRLNYTINGLTNGRSGVCFNKTFVLSHSWFVLSRVHNIMMDRNSPVIGLCPSLPKGGVKVNRTSTAVWLSSLQDAFIFNFPRDKIVALDHPRLIT